MDIEWGKPCACSGAAPGAAAVNPPLDLEGVFAVYDVLARAVAIGKLSQGLGLAGGAELAAAAKNFAATSPTLAAAGSLPETGGFWGSVAGAGKGALGTVERTAAALWRNPKSLLAVGAVAYALATVSQSEAVALSAIASDTDLKRQTLLRMSPEAAAGWLAANPTLPPDDGGLFGDLGWIKWAALAVGGLVVWQIVKAVK